MGETADRTDSAEIDCVTRVSMGRSGRNINTTGLDSRQRAFHRGGPSLVVTMQVVGAGFRLRRKLPPPPRLWRTGARGPGRSGAASRAVGAGRGSATGSPASRLLRRSSNDAVVHGRGRFHCIDGVANGRAICRRNAPWAATVCHMPTRARSGPSGGAAMLAGEARLTSRG